MQTRLHSLILFAFFFVPLASVAQYCTPDANCTDGDGIRLFTIGSFSNESECEADMDIPGYGDFTGQENLILGQAVTYETMFRSDYQNQQFSIWIDGDDSESFEESELILADVLVGLEVVSGVITIPVDMPLGPHRLRVKATWNGPSSDDPCMHGGTYGEIEDYTVIITEAPSCINVSGVESVAISATSATITWVDPGTASVWDVEWGIAGFEPTGNPSPGYDDIDIPADLTGLNPVTEYDVYIRADCGMDNETDVSIWTSGYTFITACGAVAPDYYQDFNDGAGQCWEYFGLGTLDEGPLEGGESNWEDDGFANTPNVFTGCQGIYTTGSDTYQWMISPDFDLGAGPFQVEFDLSMTAPFSQNPVIMGVDDKVVFLVSTNFGTSWITLNAWEQGTDIAPSGEHIVHDLSAYDGEIVSFAYYVTSGETEDDVQFQTFVDNFRVQSLGADMQVTVDQIIEAECSGFGNQEPDVLISISGGTPPYTFLWSDESENEDLIDAEVGSYTVTVTDSEGVVYNSEPIVVPGLPVFTITADVTDETYFNAGDGTITITDVQGGAGNYTYFWNNGATETGITDLFDAFWCVTVTDVNNCQTDTCFEVLAGDPNGLLDLSDAISMQIMPNPLKEGQAIFRADLGSGQDWSIDVVDALGRSVLSSLILANGIHEELIDLRAYEQGVYSLLVTRHSDGARAVRLLMR